MVTIAYAGVPVHIGEVFPEGLPAQLHRAVIVTDEHVQRHWGHAFPDLPCIVLPPGEDQKTLVVVEKLVTDLVTLGADRGSSLLAIGGGVICDLTGFVASVYMRGIPFAFVPTTLLAQVDASIGGKNGVNTDRHKNMIGVFRQPQAILSDPRFLSTLPDAEFRNGLAECIKHACIRSQEDFLWMEYNMEGILARDPELLNGLILRSVSTKCAIVEADPLEQGDRRLLNFGHTFGHAIEKSQGMAHGQAISLGMVLVNEMAVRLGMLDAADGERVRNLLDRAGLPTDVSALDMDLLRTLIRGDKKKVGDHMAFILLKGIGDAVIHKLPLDD